VREILTEIRDDPFYMWRSGRLRVMNNYEKDL